MSFEEFIQPFAAAADEGALNRRFQDAIGRLHHIYQSAIDIGEKITVYGKKSEINDLKKIVTEVADLHSKVTRVTLAEDIGKIIEFEKKLADLKRKYQFLTKLTVVR